MQPRKQRWLIVGVAVVAAAIVLALVLDNRGEPAQTAFVDERAGGEDPIESITLTATPARG